MLGHLSTAIVVVTILFAVLAAVTVGLRFYCRSYKKTALGIDDWLLLPSILCAVGTAIANCINVYMGNLGEHGTLGPDGTISDDTFLMFNLATFINEAISIPGFVLTKLSILFFYRRIFRGRLFNAVTWALIALNIAWGLGFWVATMAQCTPIQANWDPTYPAEDCYKSFPMYLGLAGSNFLLDVMILCVPWPNIWQLQLPTRQKFALAGIFMLGALVCGIGIARFVFFEQAVTAPLSDFEDPTYFGAPPIYWTGLEASIGVICACLPTLRPLFQGFSPESIFGSRGGRISSHGSEESSGIKEIHGVTGNSSFALNQLNTRLSDDATMDPVTKTGIIVVQHEYDLTFASLPKQAS